MTRLERLNESIMKYDLNVVRISQGTGKLSEFHIYHNDPTKGTHRIMETRGLRDTEIAVRAIIIGTSLPSKRER